MPGSGSDPDDVDRSATERQPLSLLKKIAMLLFGLFAILFVLLALLVGAGIFLNDRAESRAAAFCDGIALSSPVVDAVAWAERQDIRHLTTRDPVGEIFVFPGWVFNSADCQVEVQDGMVTKKGVSDVHD